MSPTPRFATLLLSACFAFPSCAESTPPIRWPEGTAVLVGSLPISRAEIESVADSLALVNPIHTRLSLRREALLAQLFPRAAARLAGGELVELTRQKAEAGLSILKGDSEGPMPFVFERTGFTLELGFDLWSRSRELEVGTWQGPFEGIGTWYVIQVVARDTGPEGEITGEETSGGEGKQIELHYAELKWAEWSFVDADWDESNCREICAAAGVVAVDPKFDDLIPFTYRRKEER